MIDQNSVLAKLAEKIEKEVTADAEKECKQFKQQVYDALHVIFPNPHSVNYKLDINGASVPLYDLMDASGCKYVELYKRVRIDTMASKMLSLDKQATTPKSL